jgi:transposase
VARLLYRQAPQHCATPKRQLPTRMGLEAFAQRNGPTYATMVVKRRTHHVCEVLATRPKATVATFLAAPSERRRGKVATLERRRECRAAVHAQCPWAWIVIERFPVVKLVTAALHHSRPRLTRQAPEADRKRLQESRARLGQATQALTEAQRADLYRVRVDFPELRCAPSLVHWLRRWYALADVQVAQARLRAWLSRGKQAHLPERHAVAATSRRWRPWMVPFCRDRVTNGPTEGINNKMKRMKRTASGLPNFAHIRARVLMAFAPAVTSPP